MEVLREASIGELSVDLASRLCAERGVTAPSAYRLIFLSFSRATSMIFWLRTAVPGHCHGSLRDGTGTNAILLRRRRFSLRTLGQ
jgi:hypothetical protein